MRVKASSSAEPAAFDVDRVRFVLVQPQFGGNVGSAARALKNLGFSRLSLVLPRCDHLGREARMMAVEAVDLLETAQVHRDLDLALAGAGTVLGSTRRVGKQRRPHWRLDQLVPDLARLASVAELAIVFGREDNGLSDAELDRCTHLIYLPAAAEYASFNLAQAVLLVAYELRLAGLERPAGDALGSPADHESREAFYRHLEQALLTIGFLDSCSAQPIMRRLRRLFGRAEMRPEEVKLLRGIARQTLWAAARAGLRLPPQSGARTDQAAYESMATAQALAEGRDE